MKNLDNKKNGTFNNIPSNHLKEVSEVTSSCLTNIWKTQIISGQIFPDNLKLADSTPVFKKKDSNLAKNYRPVNVLPAVSKIFERQLQKQTISYIDQFLSKFLCGCRKDYSTQTTFISMLENWRKTLDIKGYADAFHMDLSKAFDTVNNELLLAKSRAYSFLYAFTLDTL